MLVKLVTKAHVVSTRILPGGVFELVLDVPRGDVANLFSVPGKPEDIDTTAALKGAYLGVGDRGTHP